MSELRLLVIAADPLARAGLAMLLGDQEGLEVVGQAAGRGRLALELDVYRPDLLLWDLGWELEDGLESLADIEPELEESSLPVLALLAGAEDAPAVWGAGVRSLLRRDAPLERLLAAVQGTAQGLSVIEPDLAAYLLPPAPVLELPEGESLTPRELEVLQLLAEGLANKAIARQLAISDHTVKFHVNAIMGKLGAQSRTAAVVQAMRMGLILL